MTKKCLARVEALLSKSSIRSVKKDEIINQIKIAQAEQKISSIDEINVDKISQEVSEQIKLQKKINKRNFSRIKGIGKKNYLISRRICRKIWKK